MPLAASQASTKPTPACTAVRIPAIAQDGSSMYQPPTNSVRTQAASPAGTKLTLPAETPKAASTKQTNATTYRMVSMFIDLLLWVVALCDRPKYLGCVLAERF